MNGGADLVATPAAVHAAACRVASAWCRRSLRASSSSLRSTMMTSTRCWRPWTEPSGSLQSRRPPLLPQLLPPRLQLRQWSCTVAPPHCRCRLQLLFQSCSCSYRHRRLPSRPHRSRQQKKPTLSPCMRQLLPLLMTRCPLPPQLPPLLLFRFLRPQLQPLPAGASS